MPSWYTGTDADSEASLVGKDRALDPAKYFIILTNLLANGVSPSNTAAPFEMGRFPKITLHDNVRLQHKLVTDTLGLQTLRLVTGCSMGACQAYKWAAQYPDLVRAGAPIAGSARTASNNKVFLSLRRALELDPAFRAGFYDRPPSGGLRAFAAIYAAWGLSEPFYRKPPSPTSARMTTKNSLPISGNQSFRNATRTTSFRSSGLGKRATSATTRCIVEIT